MLPPNNAFLQNAAAVTHLIDMGNQLERTDSSLFQEVAFDRQEPIVDDASTACISAASRALSINEVAAV